jgi:hypothetical protein
MEFRTRMMARIVLTVGAGLCTFGYARCSFVSDTGGTSCSGMAGYGTTCGGTSGGGSNGGGSSGYTTSLMLRDSTGVETTSVVMGESIRFDLEILNNANMATSLLFPDTQIYDFYVLDANGAGVRWRWSEGMAFAPGNTKLAFTPYASKAYSVIWNGVLSDGTQLPAGNYRARGVIVAVNFLDDPTMTSDLGSNIVNFSVR